MANWYGAARTNYVKVTDMEGLTKSLADFDLDIVVHDGEYDPERKGLVAFFPTDDSNGDFQYSTYDEDGNEVEFDWESKVMPYVEENNVLVTMCSGAEKQRYITGDSAAYIRRGDAVSVVGICLNDIYDKAAEAFEVEKASIGTAMY
jgi:hypothetical protein